MLSRHFNEMHTTSRNDNEYGHSAIDIEMTGLDPLRHDIIELALQPLDNSFEPLADIPPCGQDSCGSSWRRRTCHL